MAAVLVVSRVLVVSELTVDLGLPFLALVAVVGLVLSRARLRAIKVDPWAAAAAVGVGLVVAAPAIGSGDPTFTGSLVLGDTAHQLTLADRLGEAGTESQPLPNSSYELSVRKYFASAYPLGSQAALGLLAPLGLLDLAWLYLPFLAVMLALTALSLNSLLTRAVKSRRGRAAVTFVATQSSLVIAFAQQGSIKEMTALATVTLTFALALLVTRRPLAGARLHCARALRAGHGGRAGAAGGGLRRPAAAHRRGLLAGEAAEYPTADRAAGGGRGGPRHPAARPAAARRCLDGGHDQQQDAVHRQGPGQPGPPARRAAGVGRLGGGGLPLRAQPARPPVAVAAIGCASPGCSAWSWRCAAGRSGHSCWRARWSRSPAFCCSGATPTPTRRCSCWLRSWCRCSRCARRCGCSGRATGAGGCWAALVGVLVTAAVLAGNALAYHDVQLAPYDRYEEQISIAEQLEGKGPVVFAEYDEFAKHFMRRSQVLSQPEWPFEFPINKLNVKGAAAHVEKNRDGLHPSFKSPLDPDGITPSSLEAASYIVLRRSPTASRPPPTTGSCAGGATTRSGSETPRSGWSSTSPWAAPSSCRWAAPAAARSRSSPARPSE